MKTTKFALIGRSLLTLICFIYSITCQGGIHSKFSHSGSAREASNIDQNDTVFFDLTHPVPINNYFEIPVFIKSDDVINSLDLNIKFDTSKFKYDSMIVYRPSMDPIPNYNYKDSTLYLTSFDVSPIPNNIRLVSLRFKSQNGLPITKNDFISVGSLLNGIPNACTSAFFEGDMSAIISISADDLFRLNAYPNPTLGTLNIDVSQNATVQIISMNGSQVLMEKKVRAGQRQTVDTNNLPDGIYLISAVSNHLKSVKRVVISNGR